jgi:hypothetical protein
MRGSPFFTEYDCESFNFIRRPMGKLSVSDNDGLVVAREQDNKDSLSFLKPDGELGAHK